jgi:hypothetical protein
VQSSTTTRMRMRRPSIELIGNEVERPAIFRELWDGHPGARSQGSLAPALADGPASPSSR